TFLQTFVGVLMLLPFCDLGVFGGLTTSYWVYILGTAIIHTGFVYYLFFDIVRNLPTIIVSVLVFVDPFVAILLDTILLDFRPTLLQTFGIASIFGGILYTVFKPVSSPAEVLDVKNSEI